jgi:hypothetical protein
MGGDPVLLIIVGAGATYDSDWRRRADQKVFASGQPTQWGLKWRPPLAIHLFNEDRFGQYVARYPPSQGLMDQLRQAGDAVEAELERIRDLSKGQDYLPRMLLAVRYYLRDLISETVQEWNSAKPDKMTNFTRLIAKLEPWRQQRTREQGAPERVAIATFNYDTLFDDALTNLLPGFPLWTIDDYVSDPRYQLFKLHGSVNWWREVRGEVIAGKEWIGASGQSSSAAGWARTMFDPPGWFAETGKFHVSPGLIGPCVPCLALPTATKGPADFACPEAHMDALRLLLPEVTDVLILGWKGVEGHFLEEWRKVQATKPDRTIRSLTVVDSAHDLAVGVAHRLVQTVGIAPQETPTFETFSGFVIDNLDFYLRETLKAPAA